MDQLEDWLFGASLPLWLAQGIDREAAGFHEDLQPDTYICRADFRRLRVAARQTYVFARAHAAGLPGADEAVALGVDFLTRRAALPEGGYAARFDLAGRVIDARRELYDQAFVLLALATAAQVLPAAPLRAAALKQIGFITAAFAHEAGGFAESLPHVLPRRQNPHMHLLEASLAAHQAFGDPVFLATARGVVALLLNRFHHTESGALLEFFADDWQPRTNNGRLPVEPGHCCEWVWLVHDYLAAAGPDAAVSAAAAAMMAFVDRHGAHPNTGDLIDCVCTDGAPMAATARLWPQTERLKAAVLRADATAAGTRDAADRLASRLKPDGLWCERRNAAGSDIAGPAPASSLYHLTCAILVARDAQAPRPAQGDPAIR